MSLKKEEKHTTEPFTEDLVAKYLKENPEFFVKNSAILSELNIPHETGTAISLVEKQLLVLREQNKETNEKIYELIEIARKNEALARRMHQLALTLMDNKEPGGIFIAMYDDLKKNFHADIVAVRLFVHSSIINDSSLEEFVEKNSIEKNLFKELLEKKEPVSGKMNLDQQAFLFNSDLDVGAIASSVIVPLYGKNWEGILAIGSFDSRHFQPGMGIELLSNLGEMLSLIIKPWAEEK